MSAREAHLVELVDPAGTPVGATTVQAAHTAPGQLHRAFSVFLLDRDGRVLLQQRAAVKTRFPLRWANTCCGHPLPGEDLAVAATRRLAEELGLPAVPLSEAGVYAYYAEDPASGRVEYEYDHVLVGTLPVGVEPDPDRNEVADIRWESVPALLAQLERDPSSYSPWLAGVTHRLAEHLAGAVGADSFAGVVPRQARSVPADAGSLPGGPLGGLGTTAAEVGGPGQSSGLAGEGAWVAEGGAPGNAVGTPAQGEGPTGRAIDRSEPPERSGGR